MLGKTLLSHHFHTALMIRHHLGGKTEAINKMSPVLPSCQENWLQLECELKRLGASSRLHYLGFFWNELEQHAPATHGSYWAAEPEWKGQLALDPAHSARTWSLYSLKRDALFICTPVTAFSEGQNNFPRHRRTIPWTIQPWLSTLVTNLEVRFVLINRNRRKNSASPHGKGELCIGPSVFYNLISTIFEKMTSAFTFYWKWVRELFWFWNWLRHGLFTHVLDICRIHTEGCILVLGF